MKEKIVLHVRSPPPHTQGLEVSKHRKTDPLRQMKEWPSLVKGQGSSLGFWCMSVTRRPMLPLGESYRTRTAPTYRTP